MFRAVATMVPTKPREATVKPRHWHIVVAMVVLSATGGAHTSELLVYRRSNNLAPYVRQRRSFCDWNLSASNRWVTYLLKLFSLGERWNRPVLPFPFIFSFVIRNPLHFHLLLLTLILSHTEPMIYYRLNFCTQLELCTFQSHSREKKIQANIPV